VRIRSIKPEFWKSERMATLPREVRLLFIGLWNLADDYGRFRAHPRLVRGELFPFEDDVDVEAMLQQLAAAGVVVLYQHDGHRYGHVRNFGEHQKIDRRAESRLPPPPSGGRPPQNGVAHPQPPAPAEASAEPSHIPAEPAEVRVLDQGSGIRDLGVPPPTPSDPPRSARGGRRLAARDPEPDPAPATETESAAPPPRPRIEPASDPQQPDLPRRAAVVQLQEALTRTRYRSAVPAMKRRFVLRHEAARLVATGLTPFLLGELVDLATEKADRGQDHGGLLAHWLDGGAWREVLDEVAAKAKAAGLRAREPREAGEPIAAASVVGDVLRATANGRPS
jgi:hypothetical protein